jgi:hypothetical protein
LSFSEEALAKEPKGKPRKIKYRDVEEDGGGEDKDEVDEAEGLLSDEQLMRLSRQIQKEINRHAKSKSGNKPKFRRLYNKFDTDSNHEISAQEFWNGLDSIGIVIDKAHARQILAVFDTDSNQSINVSRTQTHSEQPLRHSKISHLSPFRVLYIHGAYWFCETTDQFKLDEFIGFAEADDLEQMVLRAKRARAKKQKRRKMTEKVRQKSGSAF